MAIVSKKETEKSAEQSPVSPVVQSIKGFRSDLTCAPDRLKPAFKFEIGKSYSLEGKIGACHFGFHACPADEHPLSVFEYYPPAGARYADVEQSGASDRKGNKLASASITIKAEISLSDLIARAVKWVFDRSTPEGEVATGNSGAASATGNSGAASATGYSGAASATGNRGAASATGNSGAASATGNSGAASATGDSGAASATGNRGAASATGYSGAASATGDSGAASATGNRGAASATGYSGAASATGYSGAASATGDSGAASATGNRGAASATGYSGAASATGNRGAASATGNSGAASATGYSGAASATGDSGAASATGLHSAALGAGYGSRAMAGETGAICLVCRNDNGEIVAIRASKVGENGVNPLTWYSLSEAGEFVEVEG
jgi:hypothetical protein